MEFDSRLKPLYAKLLSDHTDEIFNGNLSCLPGIQGKYYNSSSPKLMYIGRCPNGWGEIGKSHNLDKTISDMTKLAGTFNMSKISNGEHSWFNRSGFWQLCHALMAKLDMEDDWSNHIYWTNLFKVAPTKEGNPKYRLMRETLDDNIEILKKEFEICKPDYALFVTDKWWINPNPKSTTSFEKEFNITLSDDKLIVGKGVYNGVKIVVTRRPEGGPSRDTHSKAILDAFESIK